MRNLLRMFPKTATAQPSVPASPPQPAAEPMPPRPSGVRWGQSGIHDPAEDPCGRPPISSKEASRGQ